MTWLADAGPPSNLVLDVELLDHVLEDDGSGEDNSHHIILGLGGLESAFTKVKEL